MKTIYFKFNGGKSGSWENPAEGWLAVGDCGLHGDTRLLSASCVSIPELEEAASELKRLIDEAVADGRKMLSKSKPS